MKVLKIAALVLTVLFVVHAPAMAQTDVRTAYASGPKPAISDLRPIGIGLAILGAALGIGMLAKSAVESMARQPEVAGSIQTAMIIAAALIEGATFFALIILMLFASPFPW
jgi:F-type H+-transporting ATPase subunit c